MRRVISIIVVVTLAACSKSAVADAKPQATPAAAALAAKQATPATRAPEQAEQAANV